MTIRHQYTLLCDYYQRGEDGKDVFAGCFQNVQLKQLPDTLAQMWVVIAVTGDVGDPVHFLIEAPDGIVLVDFGEQTIPEIPDKASELQLFSATAAAQMKGVSFDTEGVYAVVVTSAETEIHRREFGVYVRPGGTDAGDATSVGGDTDIELGGDEASANRH